jgi:hypothetical protein
MFDRIVRPSYAESFNGTTSDLNFGTALTEPTAQSALVAFRLFGANENGLGYLFSRVPSASGNGPRLLINDPTMHVTVGFHSPGSAVNPSRNSSAAYVAVGTPMFLGFSHDGSITAANIKIYKGYTGIPMAEETSYGTTSDGGGSFDNGAANNLHIGNREGTDRTLNGPIYYLARWNRVLSLGELRQAQFNGPYHVANGLILCWANGMDHGPYKLRPTSRADIGRAQAWQHAPLIRSSHRRLVAA